VPERLPRRATQSCAGAPSAAETAHGLIHSSPSRGGYRWAKRSQKYAFKMTTNIIGSEQEFGKRPIYGAFRNTTNSVVVTAIAEPLRAAQVFIAATRQQGFDISVDGLQRIESNLGAAMIPCGLGKVVDPHKRHRLTSLITICDGPRQISMCANFSNARTRAQSRPRTHCPSGSGSGGPSQAPPLHGRLQTTHPFGSRPRQGSGGIGALLRREGLYSSDEHLAA
jgi:hypothetical protein